MDWEEALLMTWGREIPQHPAAYYRQQAARARQVAEGVTTRAMKVRLLDEAVHCDLFAAGLIARREKLQVSSRLYLASEAGSKVN
jgi:hypothetical protein